MKFCPPTTLHLQFFMLCVAVLALYSTVTSQNPADQCPLQAFPLFGTRGNHLLVTAHCIKSSSAHLLARIAHCDFKAALASPRLLPSLTNDSREGDPERPTVQLSKSSTSCSLAQAPSGSKTDKDRAPGRSCGDYAPRPH